MPTSKHALEKNAFVSRPNISIENKIKYLFKNFNRSEKKIFVFFF